MKHFMLQILFITSAGWGLLTNQALARKFTVVTTFTVIADMAQNVAGDDAKVVSITKPGAEIHDYEPTPQDIVHAQDGDLILYNGMHLERWFEKFYGSLKDIPSAVVTEGITPMLVIEGPYTGLPNPHAWMSVSNAQIYVDNIAKALSQYDPTHAADYARNAAAYKGKLVAMDQNIHNKLVDIPEQQRYLVSSEGAFSYLARDLNMKEAYLWPINAEQEGTPQQIRKLIGIIRDNHIPVLFSESTISDKPAKQVAKETGALYGGVLYVDSLSEPDGPTPTYLDLLKVTTDTIIDGFKKALEQNN